MISQSVYSQNVNIPDPIFKSYVLSKCDTSNDGNVQIEEANLMDSLVIESMGISDLTGIEYFSNLLWIQCGGNNISTLNTSNNPALEFIHCNGNQLTSIDVSNNPVLYYLECRANQLSALDFRNGNSVSYLYLDTRNNQNLLCVSVDDTSFANSSIYFYRDLWTSYNNDCTVGIEENTLSNLSLYPNPTTRTINIDLGELKTGVKATLTNSLGQVILTQQFESTDIINLDIGAPTGIYFLQIETTEGETKTLKVLKE